MDSHVACARNKKTYIYLFIYLYPSTWINTHTPFFYIWGFWCKPMLLASYQILHQGVPHCSVFFFKASAASRVAQQASAINVLWSLCMVPSPLLCVTVLFLAFPHVQMDERVTHLCPPQLQCMIFGPVDASNWEWLGAVCMPNICFICLPWSCK